MAEDYRAKGDAVRNALMGEALGKRMAQAADDPIMGKFRDYATEAVFGMLWARPGLDLKTRIIVVVAYDVAQARFDELAVHLRMAREQGWTEDELTEALLQLAAYAGLPAARQAMLTAKATFEAMRKEAAAG